VNAEPAAFLHQPLKSRRRVSSHLVVAGQEVLELVDQQQDPRQRLASGAVFTELLGPGALEQAAAPLHFGQQCPEDGQSEFAIRFEGDGTGMGQGSVRGEPDAVLEVEEVQLELARRVTARQPRNEDVEQVRLAHASHSADEAMGLVTAEVDRNPIALGIDPKRDLQASHARTRPIERRQDRRC
jgi:hypothetical protein